MQQTSESSQFGHSSRILASLAQILETKSSLSTCSAALSLFLLHTLHVCERARVGKNSYCSSSQTLLRDICAPLRRSVHPADLRVACLAMQTTNSASSVHVPQLSMTTPSVPLHGSHIASAPERIAQAPCIDLQANTNSSMQSQTSAVGNGAITDNYPLWEDLVTAAESLRDNWVHPADSQQIETDLLHMCRAMLRNSKLNMKQSFVAQRSQVSQASLSLYLRGLFRGNQGLLEQRLLKFLKDITSGNLENVVPALDGRRKLSASRSSAGRPSSTSGAQRSASDSKAPAAAAALTANTVSQCTGENAVFAGSAVNPAAPHHRQLMEQMAAAARHREVHEIHLLPSAEKCINPAASPGDKYIETARRCTGKDSTDIASQASKGIFVEPMLHEKTPPQRKDSLHEEYSVAGIVDRHQNSDRVDSNGVEILSNRGIDQDQSILPAERALLSYQSERKPSSNPKEPPPSATASSLYHSRHILSEKKSLVQLHASHGQENSAVATEVQLAPEYSNKSSENAVGLPQPQMLKSQNMHGNLHQQLVEQPSEQPQQGPQQLLQHYPQMSAQQSFQQLSQPATLQIVQPLPEQLPQHSSVPLSQQSIQPQQHLASRSIMPEASDVEPIPIQLRETVIGSGESEFSSGSNMLFSGQHGIRTVRNDTRATLPRQSHDVVSQFEPSRDKIMPQRQFEVSVTNNQYLGNQSHSARNCKLPQSNSIRDGKSAGEQTASQNQHHSTSQVFTSGVQSTLPAQMRNSTEAVVPGNIEQSPAESRAIAPPSNDVRLNPAGRAVPALGTSWELQEKMQQQYMERLQLQQIQSMQQAQQIKHIQEQYQRQQAQRQLQAQLIQQGAHSVMTNHSGHHSSAQRTGVATRYPNSSGTAPLLGPATQDTGTVNLLNPVPIPPQSNESMTREHISSAQPKRPRSAYGAPVGEQLDSVNPTMAVDRAYHAFTLSRWEGHSEYVEPLLLPIELFVEDRGVVLHFFTQWDVNEREISPETAAEQIVNSRGLPLSFVKHVTALIRRRLFDAGVIPPPPPLKTGNMEKLSLIKIFLELEENGRKQVLDESFEWDLGAGLFNSPEIFAQSLCADAGISQKHASTVARAIRREVSRANAIAFGDESTRACALAQRSLPCAATQRLPPVSSARAGPPADNTSFADASKVENETRRCNDSGQDDGNSNSVALHDIEMCRPFKHNGDAHPEMRDADINATVPSIDASELAKRRLLAEMHARKKFGIDIRPYTQMALGYCSHPSVWIGGILERRERGEPLMPGAPGKIVEVDYDGGDSEAESSEPSDSQSGPEKTSQRAASSRSPDSPHATVRVKMNGVRTSVVSADNRHSRKRKRSSSFEVANENESMAPVDAESAAGAKILRLRIRPPRKVVKMHSHVVLRLPLSAEACVPPRTD